jgi:hypothetical protein
MVQPIEAFLRAALEEFEDRLKLHPVHESQFLRAEKLVGAKLFVDFLLGKPLPQFGTPQ